MLVTQFFSLKQKILFFKYKKIMIFYDYAIFLWISRFLLLNQIFKCQFNLWINQIELYDKCVNQCAKIISFELSLWIS